MKKESEKTEEVKVEEDQQKPTFEGVLPERTNRHDDCIEPG